MVTPELAAAVLSLCVLALREITLRWDRHQRQNADKRTRRDDDRTGVR